MSAADPPDASTGESPSSSRVGPARTPFSSRRGFLKAVGIGAATGTLPPPLSLPGPPIATLPPPATLLVDEEVRGLIHHASEEALRRIGDMTALVLRRDPDNGHDPHAIGIHLECGERIGYVPRERNRMLAALLDAGHDVRGEITMTGRREFVTRLSGDQKPFGGRMILEELAPDDDGARRVRMAELGPRFRAWLATGVAPDVRPPDPLDVPGWPGWKKLVREHEARDLHRANLAACAGAIQPGFEFGLQDGLAMGVRRFRLTLPDGSIAGHLTTGNEAIRAALEAGLEVKAVVTRVRRDDNASSNAPGCPWIEVRANGAAPAPTPGQLEAWRAIGDRHAIRPPHPLDREEPTPDVSRAALPRPLPLTDNGPATRATGGPPPALLPSPPVRSSTANLFRIADGDARPVLLPEPDPSALRELFRSHLEVLLGLRWLASHVRIGGVDIDMLALGTRFPVVLAFREREDTALLPRALAQMAAVVADREAVHRLVAEQAGREAEMELWWSQASLICIADAFDPSERAQLRALRHPVSLVRCRHLAGGLVLVEVEARTR